MWGLEISQQCENFFGIIISCVVQNKYQQKQGDVVDREHEYTVRLSLSTKIL